MPIKQFDFSKRSKPAQSDEPLAKKIEVYQPAAETTARFRFLIGGSGGGKSVFLTQDDIDRLMGEAFFRCLVIRKVRATCKDSTYQALKDVLDARGLTSRVRMNDTALSITAPNGNQILHAGLDKLEKLKSIAGARGLTHIRIEEATELRYGPGPGGERVHDFDLIMLRLRGQQARQFTLSMNPGTGFEYYASAFGLALSGAPDDFPPVRGHAQRGDVFAQHTTFEDNPYADHDAERRQYERLPPAIRTVYEKGLYAQTDRPDQLIPFALWREALRRGQSDEGRAAAREAGGGLLRLGVDVAWTGSDRTALARLEGYLLTGIETFDGQDPTRTGQLVGLRIAEGQAAERVALDDIGMGATVKSNLHAAGFMVQGFTAGASAVPWREPMPLAMKDIAFTNIRSQAWYFLRCLMEEGRFAIAPLPPDIIQRLQEDFLAPRYRLKQKGLLEVEPKSTPTGAGSERTAWGIKQRLGRSTDDGDAVVMGLFADFIKQEIPLQIF